MESDSLVCSICIQLFVKPVMLPCGHEFCLDCLKSSVDVVSLQCPVCRKRISIWVRKRKLSDELINKQKWNYILDNFRELIEKRLDNSGECIDEQQPLQRSLSSNGEIRKEYLQELNKVKQERQLQIEEEESKSMQLIQKLISEEEEYRRQFVADEQFAKQLQEEQLREHISRNRRTYDLRRRKHVDYFKVTKDE